MSIVIPSTTTDDLVAPAGADARPVHLSSSARRRFVLSYVRSKTIGLLAEVGRGRVRLLAYEAVYSVCRALGVAPRPMRWLRLARIDTRFGRFALRPGTIDAACASPAFERPDVDRLLVELDAYRRADRSVLFLDVGADLGTYSVTVARAMPGAEVVAFEPAAGSRALLERNLALNAVQDRVTVVPAACGEQAGGHVTLTFNADEPGSSGIRETLVAGTRQEEVALTSIDATLAGRPLDVLVIKADVEGFEVPALRGAESAVARARETLLLVEDFVDDAVVEHLRRTGWTFVDKLTPYNSFWRRSR